MKGVRSGFRFLFFFLHVGVHLFEHHLLKTLSLLHCIAFVLLSKVNLPYLCGSISGLYSALLVFVLLPIPNYFDDKC